MTAPKQPQDRKPKAVKDDTPIGDGGGNRAHMTLTVDDVTYTSTEPISDAVTMGMMRRWKDDQMRLTIEVVEKLFNDQPKALDALDTLTLHQFEAMGQQIFGAPEDEGNASMGESGRSST